MQDSSYLDMLKERYRFDEWKDGGGGVSYGEQGVSFSGNEFAGWRLTRQMRRSVNLPGVRSLMRSMWQGASSDQLLGMDVYECDSPATARDTLLRLLGEFQGPALSRVSGIGDVAFGTPGDTVVVLVRGSAVAAVRNAGRQVRPLGDVARGLDAILSPRPPQGSRRGKQTP